MSPLALQPGMSPLAELVTKIAIVVQLVTGVFNLGLLAWVCWTYRRRS